MTIVEGIDEKQLDIKELTKSLKSKLACGGTSKNGRIELQGNHKARVREVLVEMGFSPEMVDMGYR
jgi:translation initiation factor 1